MALLSQLIDDESSIKYKKKIDIVSPISGQISSLDTMPCPLFAERLYGEGYAIDPAGYQVVSPFLARVEEFSTTGEFIKLRSKAGLIMQIQMGFDAFRMHGEGFKPQVKVGQTVKAGELLLTFDLIKMKKSLESVTSAVTFLNSDKLKAIRLNRRKVIAGEDTAMSLYI